MNRSANLFLLAWLGLALIAAGEPAAVVDRLREANDAFARGDWETAEGLYSRSEERADDPGLVAFNKGSAHYRHGDYRRAEVCFRRSLGDAAIPAERRGRALYNLGNCLVHEAGDADVKNLQAAIECFGLAARDAPDDGTRSDARHNLEVAKLLWAKARAKRPPGERDPEWDDRPDSKRPPEGPKPPDTGSEGTDDGSRKGDPGAKLELGKGPEAGTVPKEAPKPAPGAGNLPVIEDKSQVTQQTPEDARAELKRNTDRILRERQKFREEAAQGDRPRAKDW